MILHGGSQGELTKYGMPTEYVYEWTCEELQSDRIDIGEGERIPRLIDLIQLYENEDDILLNIELKGPEDPEYKKRYDFDLAAKTVYDMINDNGIAHKVMVSSFQEDIITSMKEVSKKDRQFLLQ